MKLSSNNIETVFVQYKKKENEIFFRMNIEIYFLFRNMLKCISQSENCPNNIHQI